VHRISIPRWLLIATAALLAFAIFVIVVHPYYNVTSATVGERILLAFVVTTAVNAAVGMVFAPRVFLSCLPEPKPVPIIERNCTRRV
jgi:hypothetical protein